MSDEQDHPEWDAHAEIAAEQQAQETDDRARGAWAALTRPRFSWLFIATTAAVSAVITELLR